MSLPIFRGLEVTEKGWGEERLIANHALYCGKLLCFKEGARFSSHFHRDKAESFYVLAGTVRFDWIDPQDATECSRSLAMGDVVDIPPLCIHRVTALTESVIIEVSNHHEDSDSYRVAPGDSQK